MKIINDVPNAFPPRANPSRHQLYKSDQKGGRGGPSSEAPPAKKIFVGGIPQSTVSEWLEEAFASYGDISKIEIPKNERSHGLKGYAILHMADPNSAKTILMKKSYLIKGKLVSVREAVSKASAKKRKRVADKKKLYVTGLGDSFSENQLK